MQTAYFGTERLPRTPISMLEWSLEFLLTTCLQWDLNIFSGGEVVEDQLDFEGFKNVHRQHEKVIFPKC